MLMRRRFLLTFALFTMAVVVGCKHPQAATSVANIPSADAGQTADQSGGGRFLIFATNDFHGQLVSEAQPFSHGKPVGGAAVLKAYADQLRAQGPVLMLDAGDFMQGAPESALFGGRSVIAYMNAAGYKAAAIGNHEFDWGIDVLAQRASEAQFPLLCANLLDARTGQPFAFTKPSTLVEIAGTRVGLIGVITEGLPGLVSKSARERLKVTSAAEAASAQAALLRAQGAQVIVLLAHLGGTHSSKTDTVSGEVGKLAEQLSGKVDIILSGHTHTKLNARANGILITQAFSKGTAFASIDVAGSGPTLRTQAQIVTSYAEKVAPDASIQALLKPYFDEVQAKLSAVIGEAAENLSNKAGGQSPMGCLLADAIREASGAQIAFTNAGGIRNGITAGKITLRTVFNIVPFDNLIYRGKASGATVLKILGHGREPLQVSGVIVSGRGRSVQARLSSGEAIREGGQYTIAANDFIWGGAGGFDMFPQADTTFPTTLVRDALSDYIRKHSPVRVPDTSRWE